MFALPPITQALILANVGVFLLQSFAGDVLIANFALWPLGSSSVLGGEVGFELWQIVTYGFLHGNLWHLFFNMFAVFMFGADLERLFGPRRYLALYFASVITAAIAQLLVSGIANPMPYPTVGASGGVFGLLLAFGMYFPHRMIVLLFPPIPMPAWLFVMLYGALELVLGVTGTQEGVAHFAHLGGMLGAFLVLRFWRGRSPYGSRRR
jgi:membrane associated rhomboid family serine protease